MLNVADRENIDLSLNSIDAILTHRGDSQFLTMQPSDLSIYNWPISVMDRVLANVPGDQGSMSGRVIPKTKKVVLESPLFKPQHYKIQIKGKV